MKIDQEGWVPLTDYASEQFVNGYTGTFAQNLQVNQPRLERFLDLAFLDGRVLLTDKTSSRHRGVGGDLNSDGSLSGKKGLRWGDKVETKERTTKKTITTKPDPAGWVVAIDGDQIRDRVTSNWTKDVRSIGEEFGRRFNRDVSRGLSRVLVADKLTTAKDSYITGRCVSSVFYGSNLLQLVTHHDFGSAYAFSVNLLLTAMLNFGNSVYKDRTGDKYILSRAEFNNVLFKVYCLYRRDLRNWIEMIGPAVPVDRLALSEGYLQAQRLGRHPLIRFNQQS